MTRTEIDAAIKEEIGYSVRSDPRYDERRLRLAQMQLANMLSPPRRLQSVARF